MNPSSMGMRVFGAGVTFGLLLGGCSIVLDANKKQCSAHTDCLTLLDQDLSYACVNSFCVQQSCSNDAQCQGRGPDYAVSVCGGDQLCQSAECNSNAECEARGAVFAGSVCMDNACQAEPI